MPDLIQLIYASRSNLHSHASPSGIEPGIARILTQSRRNNTPKNIGGVLCFGDDHFFQCLEGEREVVEGLYDRLHDDDRHREVTLLLKRPVRVRRFKLWSMKYLSVDRDIRQFLDQHKLDSFDPLRFDEGMIDDVLDVLQKAVERQHVSAGDRDSAEEASARRDHRPLIYLGIGAVVAAVTTVLLLTYVI